MSAKIRVEFTPRLRALASLNDQTGPVGRGTKAAADKTVRRSKALVSSFGRVDTGFMRDSISATFRGSNQHAVRFAVSSQAPYAIFQHQGTSRGITPAPFLRDAIDQLRPEDFRDQGL